MDGWEDVKPRDSWAWSVLVEDVGWFGECCGWRGWYEYGRCSVLVLSLGILAQEYGLLVWKSYVDNYS